MKRLILMNVALAIGVALMALSAFGATRSDLATTPDNSVMIESAAQREASAGWVLQNFHAGDLDCDARIRDELRALIVRADQVYFIRSKPAYIFIANNVYAAGQERTVTTVVLATDRMSITAVRSEEQKLTVTYSGPADQPVASAPTFRATKIIANCERPLR